MDCHSPCPFPICTRRASRPDGRRGFTAIELSALVVVLIVVALVLMPVTLGPRRGCNRQLKDSTQVRGIIQAMVIWAQNTQGKYPIPSDLDVADATVASADWGPGNKNTTGHVLSLLIFNGNISTELCVSPAEVNKQVRHFGNYEFTHPARARRPADALWDPAFRGTPTGDPDSLLPALAEGHNSYAQLVTPGARSRMWADTFATTEAVFGNRGPQYAVDDAAISPKVGRWTLLPGRSGTGSTSLLIHGGRTTWEGNIGYNDGHVSFETTPTPEGVAYSRIGDSTLKGQPDNLFVNELDEIDGDHLPGEVVRGRNAYLRPIADYTSASHPVLWSD